ncbi:MAG TPA: saccharopine dehydrogenase NADP-binding domain-containing protein [Conexibacter sp.]|nr:saccharopine dehydrogenase NADP-binding domain-containing protein [Conexibacter sp.]
MNRDFDLVVYGATGYSGRQAVAYLARRAAELDLRWAICGRDEAALNALADGPPARPEVLVADARDAAALARVAARTAAVASFIGPFGPLGDLLPGVCVEQGTHYADLCGEQDVIAARIARLHEPAQAAQVKLIPACGYESVPCDLAVLALDRAFEDADGSRVAQADTEVTFVFRRRSLRGGFGTSGGTFATVIRSATEVAHLTDPFGLTDGAPVAPDVRAANTADLSARRTPRGTWLAPTLPDPFLNAAMIQRTNILLKEGAQGGYAPGFVYREAMNVSATVGLRPVAPLAARRISALMRRIAAISAGRRDLGDRFALHALRFLSPGAGGGPSPETLDDVDYRLDVHARSTSGRHASATLHGRGNPGYRSSPNILAEAAIAMARDDDLPARYGVLTPASALGLAFVKRFPPAGLQLDVRA